MYNDINKMLEKIIQDSPATILFILATSISEKNQAVQFVGYDKKKVFVLENAIDKNTIGEDKNLEKTLKIVKFYL